MKKKPEVYFEATDYNREGWTSVGDVKNSRKRKQNERKKQKLISKKNIRIKK